MFGMRFNVKCTSVRVLCITVMFGAAVGAVRGEKSAVKICFYEEPRGALSTCTYGEVSPIF